MGHGLALAGRALAVTLMLTLPAACSSDPGDPPDEQEDQADDQAVLAVSVATVAGALDEAGREEVRQEVGAVVQAYVDEALAAGDDPFAGFTEEAARLAKGDRELLTADGDVTEAGARLSILAKENTPAGVTARISVTFTEADSGPVDLTGRLLLTPQKGQWRIYGYDLARSDGARGSR